MIISLWLASQVIAELLIDLWATRDTENWHVKRESFSVAPPYISQLERIKFCTLFTPVSILLHKHMSVGLHRNKGSGNKQNCWASVISLVISLNKQIVLEGVHLFYPVAC